MRTSLSEFNPAALIALGFRTIEVRTAFSPPVVIDLLAPNDPATEKLLREVQPAVIIAGNLGRFEIAPYGVPSGISPWVKDAAVSIGIGLGAGLLGVMFFGGVFFGRRR